MAKAVLFDRFHVSVLAPPSLPPAAWAALRRALDDPLLAAALRRAARRALRRHPALAGLVQVRVSR
jgi:hypothetical protein